MLALASHEPYFTISRDHVDFKNPNAKGRNKEEEPPGTSNFDFLHVHILREYLEAEFSVLQSIHLPFEYNFERCLDDFVFLCFFVGNDFLPHLPSLEIK
jgi:5'-3' exonuclease